MKANIFREYDIRGIVGEEFILENTYDLACAIATFLKRKSPENSRVVIGRDGRTHSLAIQREIIRGLCDSGFDVIDLGLCPSPAVYFAVYHLHIPAALVVTASHNPKHYNGIKIWGAWGTQIQAVRKLYETKDFSLADHPGTLQTYPINEPYVDYLVNHFAHLKNLPMHAIIDCGNGTGGAVIPALIKKMNWPNVKALFAEVDGTFPYHEADPTVPENMSYVAQALREDPLLEVGLGLDGDCDRMDPMTKQGELVAGDKLLTLFARNVVHKNPGVAVVCDIKGSGCFTDAIKKWGGKPCFAPSGYALIKKTMAEQGALLAGELSCHFSFHDRYFGYDDGIYAMMRTIELIHESGRTLDALLQEIPHKISSPEFRIACTSDSEKTAIVDCVKKSFAARADLELITIDGVRAHMNYGWGLLRASNTQPVICLRFESDTAEGLVRVKNDFYVLIKGYFDERTLKEKIGL
jgi:phosphomannomutase / phosphoglucomutase